MNRSKYLASFVLLALTAGVANATTYTYDVKFGPPSALVTGVITTNCDSCTLSSNTSSNVTGWSFTGSSGTATLTISSTYPNAMTFLGGQDLTATPAGIFFNFADTNISTTGSTQFQTNIAALTLYSDMLMPNPSDPFGPPITRAGFFVLETTPDTTFDITAKYLDINLQIATIANGSISTTPLPVALPLFASGLGVMGMLDWRRKRKASAAIADA
jgi:hypothetical protein